MSTPAEHLAATKVMSAQNFAAEITYAKSMIESAMYAASPRSLAREQDRLDALYASHEALRSEVSSLRQQLGERDQRIATLEAELGIEAKVLRGFNELCLAVHTTHNCACVLERGHGGDHAQTRLPDTFRWAALPQAGPEK